MVNILPGKIKKSTESLLGDVDATTPLQGTDAKSSRKVDISTSLFKGKVDVTEPFQGLATKAAAFSQEDIDFSTTLLQSDVTELTVSLERNVQTTTLSQGMVNASTIPLHGKVMTLTEPLQGEVSNQILFSQEIILTPANLLQGVAKNAAEHISTEKVVPHGEGRLVKDSDKEH